MSKVPILLLGTHADCSFEQWETDENEAIKYSKEKNFIGYFNISSENGYNIEEAFDFMATCIDEINRLNKKLTDIEFKIKL